MAAIFLVFSIGQVIGRRFGFLPIVFGVSILLAALSVVFLNLALFSPIIPISDLRPLILMIFWIGSLAVFLALTRTALKNASSIAEELADLNDQQDKEYIQGSSASLSNRDLANFLHSTVQNQLLSAAMSIESEGSHLEFSDESIRALERALMSQGTEDHGPEHSYKKSLESVVERWRPLLEIETRVSLETNRYPGVIFAQVLEEGISNAVRHGEASRLAITLSKDGDLMKLQIEDDGFGPRNGTLGLGTALFEDATNGNWQLEALDRGGSLLTLNLAL
jgi:signal transduction histidine kinase